MKSFLAALGGITILFLASCTATKKSYPSYLQQVQDTVGKGAVNYPEPTIQKGDLLSIQVYSASLDPQTDIPYNLPNQGGGGISSSTLGGGGSSSSAGSSGGGSTTGFLVDQEGNIEYPRIGVVHVEGLTKKQLAAIIKGKFESQLTDPSVIIRYMNFKVTVLGEVARPSSFSIPSERITIFDALGLAGDITPEGIKTRVKVIREINGDREIGTIDLTSAHLFESPYYILRQNDVVLVESTEHRLKEEEQQAAFRRVSFALSLVTAAALLYNIFK
ncbi:MAG TPA: polysaccharide biosynthesis/export family protein [Chitinophagaceae bacterium]|nr:polysaccharide biosynthesis/export family protein [Chitinophagaceae bacterium]